jgi:hypothetical protein
MREFSGQIDIAGPENANWPTSLRDTNRNLIASYIFCYQMRIPSTAFIVRWSNFDLLRLDVGKPRIGAPTGIAGARWPARILDGNVDGSKPLCLLISAARMRHHDVLLRLSNFDTKCFTSVLFRAFGETQVAPLGGRFGFPLLLLR